MLNLLFEGDRSLSFLGLEGVVVEVGHVLIEMIGLYGCLLAGFMGRGCCGNRLMVVVYDFQ